MKPNLPMKSLVLFVAIGFSTASSVTAEDPLVVQSVNYPLHYFAERIATKAFEPEFLVEAGVDPAFWKPNDTALLAFQNAGVILRNGADYAKWMKRVSLPSSIMVDTSRKFSSNLIAIKGEAHRHGNGEVHYHGGTASTTWIDFDQARLQAEAIAHYFKAVRPSESDAIDANLESLKVDLKKLDEEMKAVGKALNNQPLLASHPVYQYLARAYDLNIKPLEWEPTMELSAAEIEELSIETKEHSAGWMIWEGEPSAENVGVLAEQGISSVIFAPCGNRPESGDWLTAMQANIVNLKQISKTE
ncbi:MAG: metal ABC transporter substrate-binding protein [Verrucomicrobiota bacterium]